MEQQQGGGFHIFGWVSWGRTAVVMALLGVVCVAIGLASSRRLLRALWGSPSSTVSNTVQESQDDDSLSLYYGTERLLMDDYRLSELPSPSLRTLFDRIKPAHVGTLVELAPADYRYQAVQRDDVSDVRAATALTGAGTSLLPSDPRTGQFEEFGLYLDGRTALEAGDAARARELWEQLLALPPESRPWRTVWAAFMIGRSYQRTAPADAKHWYRYTRDLAAEGYSDGLGLANASLGWEARAELDTGDMVRAVALYMEQYVAGDPTAYASLNVAAWKAASGSPRAFNGYARDPLMRRVLTAWALAGGDPSARPDQCPTSEFRFAWCNALAEVSSVDPSEAAMLAWFATECGSDELAARWVAMAAPDSDLLPWLRMRAAVRTGDHGIATLAMRDLVAAMPTDDGKERWRESRYSPPSRRACARGRLGALLMSAGRFADALEEFIAAHEWEDAAYLADRVLDEDELRCFVDSLADGHLPEAQAPRSAWQKDLNAAGELRFLLARRLVRAGRLTEALDYMPARHRTELAQFRGLLAAGNDMACSADARAAALLTAARIARGGGMELMGTEHWPDGHDNDSNGGGPDLGRLRRLLTDRVLVYATADELRRVETSGAVPSQRLHYRYYAADLAWQAARLMPDNSPATAAALCEGGRWLMYRDPPAADRFYKSLVRRCGETPLGREAARVRWFPAKPKQAAG